uniref:Integrase catalytic domain-containing protein n=1 Tax=Latimeria chalumnae TaxID=7897 RepID=H2ZT72_LATCH
RGHTHILVVVCTKWVETFPMTKTTAKATAKVLLDLFCRWGVPASVELHFANEVMKQALQALGVKDHLHIPYRPQASGQVGRASISRICLEQRANWVESLPWLLMALRSKVDSRTGYSPFQLPENLLCTPQTMAETNLVHTEAWVQHLIQTCREIQLAVVKNLGVAKRQAKVYYDASSTTAKIEVGDQVMVKCFSDQGPFPQAAYEGPYLVIDKVSPTVYLIAIPKHQSVIHKYYHIMQLKKF